MKNNILVLPGCNRKSCRRALRAQNRKRRFLAAVRRLAPADALLQEAAQRVPEERIHVIPDISAVHFVVAFHHLAPQNPPPRATPAS